MRDTGRREHVHIARRCDETAQHPGELSCLVDSVGEHADAQGEIEAAAKRIPWCVTEAYDQVDVRVCTSNIARCSSRGNFMGLAV